MAEVLFSVLNHHLPATGYNPGPAAGSRAWMPEACRSTIHRRQLLLPAAWLRSVSLVDGSRRAEQRAGGPVLGEPSLTPGPLFCTGRASLLVTVERALGHGIKSRPVLAEILLPASGVP